MRTASVFLSLLLASAASAQQIPTPKPATPRPSVTPVSGNSFRGDAVVPITKAERAQVAAGKIVWKRVVRHLPPNSLDSKRLTVWIDNFSHPGPTLARKGQEDWLNYDPRRLRVTNRYIAFDAPAGDHIFYVVGSR